MSAERAALAVGLGITLPVAWLNVAAGRALPAFFDGVAAGALLAALLVCWMLRLLGRS